MVRYISSLPSPAWENAVPRTLSLLGCTGSIGVSTLKVIESHPDLFSVVALAAGRNIRLLAAQANRWRPSWLGIQDETLQRTAHGTACSRLPSGNSGRAKGVCGFSPLSLKFPLSSPLR